MNQYYAMLLPVIDGGFNLHDKLLQFYSNPNLVRVLPDSQAVLSAPPERFQKKTNQKLCKGRTYQGGLDVYPRAKNKILGENGILFPFLFLLEYR